MKSWTGRIAPEGMSVLAAALPLPVFDHAGELVGTVDKLKAGVATGTAELEDGDYDAEAEIVGGGLLVALTLHGPGSTALLAHPDLTIEIAEQAAA